MKQKNSNILKFFCLLVIFISLLFFFINLNTFFTYKKIPATITDLTYTFFAIQDPKPSFNIFYEYNFNSKTFHQSIQSLSNYGTRKGVSNYVYINQQNPNESILSGQLYSFILTSIFIALTFISILIKSKKNL